MGFMAIIQKQAWHFLMALMVILFAVSVAIAQDSTTNDTSDTDTNDATSDEVIEETGEEDLPVIPYYQSYSFNVPVIIGWDNQSGDDVAYFVNEALQSSLRVEAVNTNDAIEAIDIALRERFGNALPDEPVFINTVNLADGAWAQEVYHLENGVTISALGNRQGDRSHVITFVEENPTADTYMLIVERDTTTDADTDETAQSSATRSPQQGVFTAIETLITDDFDADSATVEDITLPSGTWTRYQYESPEIGTITAFGFVFGRAIYTTITTKDDVDGAELANAFNTLHLGFFTTPDNRNYLILGLVVSIGTLVILVMSMFWRWRGIQQDMALLQELRDN